MSRRKKVVCGAIGVFWEWTLFPVSHVINLPPVLIFGIVLNQDNPGRTVSSNALPGGAFDRNQFTERVSGARLEIE